MSAPATVRTDVSASATVTTATTFPAGTNTVPAADVSATVSAVISGGTTTADVPGTDPGATLQMFLVLLSHTKAHHTAIMAAGISFAMF